MRVAPLAQAMLKRAFLALEFRVLEHCSKVKTKGDSGERPLRQFSVGIEIFTTVRYIQDPYSGICKAFKPVLPADLPGL